MCAVAGYAAVHFGRAHVDRGTLIKAFAGYTLFTALVNLVTRRGFGEQVGNTGLMDHAICFGTIGSSERL